ncbi:MAG: cell division protein FtsZ [Bacteroidales bacterium]|nr:cell division protein FtsZ [Bacteroidales bacterium]MDD6140465.1 cell division protein FtsZ [Bacteroidales bacterium]MDD6622400.1 cell division protein FtsZ [Bacteroidales bacterium]MDD6668397.1 cell division protein FtsZ [Bacteroidales bacterium]
MLDNSQNIAEQSTVFPPIENEGGTYVSFNEAGKPLIMVIGVGGGGGNAVSHMYDQQIEGVDFVLANTDFQQLNNSQVPRKILLGPDTCGGLGAGAKPEKGRQAAEESEDEIRALFDESIKMVFITAGMGGGTGTGAAPVIARIAREMGILTIGIVTIPFLFEGKNKILKALDGADKLQENTDAILRINNQRLNEIYPDLQFDDAFAKADDTLTNAAKSISDMINMIGKTNLDFEDVNTTLRDGGTAIISSGYGEGEYRIREAIIDALNSPLLKDQNVKTSAKFLFNVYYSTKADRKFLMGEMDQMDNFMAEFNPNVDVIWGRSVDNTLGNKVKITILASGFERNTGESNLPKPKAGKTGKADDDKRQPEKAISDAERIEQAYGHDTIIRRESEAAASRYIVLSRDQIDNETIINFLEKNPTIRRGNDLNLQQEWKDISTAETQPQEERQQTIVAETKDKRQINF